MLAVLNQIADLRGFGPGFFVKSVSSINFILSRLHKSLVVFALVFSGGRAKIGHSKGSRGPALPFPIPTAAPPARRFPKQRRCFPYDKRHDHRFSPLPHSGVLRPAAGGEPVSAVL